MADGSLGVVGGGVFLGFASETRPCFLRRRGRPPLFTNSHFEAAADVSVVRRQDAFGRIGGRDRNEFESRSRADNWLGKMGGFLRFSRIGVQPSGGSIRL